MFGGGSCFLLAQAGEILMRVLNKASRWKIITYRLCTHFKIRGRKKKLKQCNGLIPRIDRWRAGGGGTSHCRRTPGENEICEVIWGSMSCFHQCGGLRFKRLCLFLFPLSGSGMNASEKGLKHTIFSIFSYLLAELPPDAKVWSFQHRNIKAEKKAICMLVSTATACVI